MGQNHRRKQWKKATAAPVTGHPANSTPKPGGCPSPPATRTPAWRTTAHQAVQPARPSTKVGPHPNQRRLRAPFSGQLRHSIGKKVWLLHSLQESLQQKNKNLSKTIWTKQTPLPSSATTCLSTLRLFEKPMEP
ncbi:hypothetical protein AMECASPLE_036087 [Ameca splendens]|uniref:Uncharacterized protein n=1 Tax=Ameca splendens TaxID=208324 RepID=A0ABV0ZGB3_9TELE